MYFFFRDVVGKPLLVAIVLVFSEIEQTKALVPAPLVVTKTADTDDGVCDSDCSLREAITASNNFPGADTIQFDIPGSDLGCNPTTGVCTISLSVLLGALPAISAPVTIDGYTQGTISTPGDTTDDASPNTNALSAGLNTRLLIELDGAVAGANANGLSIVAGGANSRVRGLAIFNFTTGSGIDIEVNGVTIDGNFIGTRADGTTQAGNNVGVRVFGLAAVNTVIGGTTVAASNLLSGNLQAGVLIAEAVTSAANRNVVQNNLIGTTITGNAALPNGTLQTDLAVAPNNGGVVVLGAGGALIGVPNIGNVIAGNLGAGVLLTYNTSSTTATSDNVVQGNLLGLGADGTTPVANVGDGVEIINGQNNTIGGANANEGNRIESNGADGVAIIGQNVLSPDSIGNSIAGNTIASNTLIGVLVTNGTGNRITANSISANLQAGIDLLGDGVTPNDPSPEACPADTDTGANNLQNFPVLTAVMNSGSNTAVTGTLNSIRPAPSSPLSSSPATPAM